MSTKITEIDKLKDTIECMDCFSQSGLSVISTLAMLSLKHLETPEGYRHLEVISNALAAIWDKAEDIQNCINTQAELVGCNYVDTARMRRMTAKLESAVA